MLQGKNVNLRLMKIEDVDYFLEEAANISQIGDYWPMHMWNRAEFVKRFNETNFWQNDNGKLIMTDKSGRILGNFNFFKGLFYTDGYEIGYRIFKPEDRGKGYTSEGLKLLVDYLFAVKPINRLQICAATQNIASQKVAQKCGFIHEGMLRQALFHRGKYYDIEMYSLLRSESQEDNQFILND